MNKYALQVVNSKKVKNYIRYVCSKQNRYDLIDDLFQYCLIQFLNKDVVEFSIKISGKSVEDYFIGIIMNQMKSNTSGFFQEYRNNGFPKVITTTNDVLEFVQDENSLTDKIIKEVNEDILLKKINDAMLKCDPFKIDLFKMKYYEDKTYKEISEYYNINIDSVINKIKSVKKNIKDMLDQNLQFGDIRRRDHELRRERQGKIAITLDIKEEIYNKNKSGVTKVKLSADYQISYPQVIKIIKNYGNNNTNT